MRPRSNALLHNCTPVGTSTGLQIPALISSCCLLKHKSLLCLLQQAELSIQADPTLPSPAQETLDGMIIGENLVLILLNRHVVPTQSLYKQLFMITKQYYYHLNKVAFESDEFRIISSLLSRPSLNGIHTFQGKRVRV